MINNRSSPNLRHAANCSSNGMPVSATLTASRAAGARAAAATSAVIPATTSPIGLTSRDRAGSIRLRPIRAGPSTTTTPAKIDKNRWASGDRF